MFLESLTATLNITMVSRLIRRILTFSSALVQHCAMSTQPYGVQF
jgi:hypothetical protein